MGKFFIYLFLSTTLTLLGNNIIAAVPIISYSPTTNTYTVGTTITTLTPTVTNGVSAIGFGTGTALTGATLNNPRGMAIDASGNVYVTNSGNNTISKYNSSGTYLGTFGTGATMSFPKYIVFDSSGNAYVLNLGATPGTGSVYKYNSSGVYQSTILSGLNYALGLTIDASDNIYVADQGATTVKKYGTSGALLLSLPTANLSTPLGVAVDASGNIYVLNNGTGNVTKYNSAGTLLSATFLTGYTSAQAITIDGAGNIYIGDNAATNIVYVYDQSGTLLTSKAVTDPEGIAVDSKGDIFASSYYANQVNEYLPTGGYFLSKALPAGLSFNSSTGSITGTPTAAMATTVYTVTAYNAGGSGSTTLSITVNPTVPTGSGSSGCSSGTAVTLTASGSTPTGGVYTWYAAITGGSSLGTGTTYTTPVITTTTTYYVDYTLNGATSTPRTAVTATITAGPVLATAPTSPAASLYLSYPFTGNANDVSGNSNNGTLQNAPTLTTDRYGATNSAYSFNGTSQYVSTATSLASPGPQNFSISVWFKTSSAGGKLVGFGNLQTGSSTSYDRQVFMGNSGQIYFGLYMSGSLKTLNTAASYADGSWHHAVATESTTNGANLYVDGVLQATDGTLTNSQSYAGWWRIGYDNMAFWGTAPTNYYFTGSLDDVAIYNTELTASQVYTLYGGGSAPVCAGSTLSLQVNTVAGATYSWSGPNSFTSTSQNPTVATATAANAGTYTVTVTAASGCTSQLKVTGVVTSSGPAIATVPTGPAAGLYLSYPFSTNPNDVSGNGNNGTLQNSPTLTTDHYGAVNSAYSFNGSTQYVSTTTLTASPGPQNFSISVWFKTSSAGGKLVGFGSLQTGSSPNNDRHIYMSNGGQLYFGLFPGSVKTINTVASYADGSWHHVVATESTTNGANLYVDGALQATDATMTASQSFAGYWRVGYDNMGSWTNAPTSYYFNGSLDDVAIYNSELTATQVNALYGAGCSSSFCAGNSLSLSANTVAGATYSWSGPGSFSSTSQNPTVPNAVAGTYTLIVTSASGCSSTINVSAPSNAITSTWTGGAGTTNPLTASNWSQLPAFNSTSNLVIPGSLSFYPSLTANETIYGLTIASGASLNLNGFTLSVGCNIYNNATTGGTGILNASNTSSNITWNGSISAQGYYGTNVANTAELGNMIVNNSSGGTVTITGGPVDVYNQLTITKGNLVVSNAGNGALTLKSTSALTAGVAAIPSSYSITGTVNVERYITGGSGYRGYRILSSPVNAGTVGINKIYSINYLINSTFLTGTDGTTGGFNKTGNPSLYLYRENMTPLYTTFLNSNNRGIKNISGSPGYLVDGDAGTFNIPIGNGYLFFFRGGLSTVNPYTASSTPVAATLTASGTLNQGDVQVSNWYNAGTTTLGYTAATPAAVRGFNMVGNPYASSIDWSGFYNANPLLTTISSANVNPTIWELKSGTNTYGTYNAQTGAKLNSGDNIIGSGEGFFIQTNNGGPPTLKFTENAKSSSQRIGPGSLASAYAANTAYSQYLILNVAKDTTNKSEILIGFNPGSTKNYNQMEDDRYISGQAPESMWITTKDSIKVVSKWLTFPKAKQTDTANLTVKVLTSGQYTLTRSDFKAIPNLYNVWLLDNYKKDSLDIKHNDKYIFDVDLGDTASYGSNRFRVVIRQDPALVVHLLDFAAAKATGGSQITWKTENEADYTNFTIERSTDNGKTFNVIGAVTSGGLGTYSLLDKNPVNNSTNWYRLKLEDLDGTISYSKAIPLMYGTVNVIASGISVYPNPATGVINLAINQPAAPVLALSGTQSSPPSVQASYAIKIINISGNIIRSATSRQPNWHDDVSTLIPGTYIIQVLNNNDKSLVGKATFVKL